MLSRRGIILSGIAVTGGLVVGYGYTALDDGDAAQKFAAAGNRGTPLNAWLKITPDSRIVCGIHRAEMGQGITTTLAMLLAEELDADWNDIDFEFVPVDKDYFNFGMLLNGQPLGDPDSSWLTATGTWAIRQAFRAIGMSMTIASSSTIDAWDTLRPAGAAARQMLLKAAARRWRVDIDTLHTEKSRVIETATGRTLSYGDLAEQAAAESPPSGIELKDPKDYTLVGRNPPRLDTPLKVTGAARFGLDVHLPGMAYAAIVHSPVAGTQIESFDTNGAESMPGILSIVTAGAPGKEQAVAVIAENSWQALQAASQISITPQMPAAPVDSDSLADDYHERLNEEAPIIFAETGSEDPTDDDNADNLVMAEYSVPFLAHLCMEPMNCTTQFRHDSDGDRLEVWAPTQANSVARDIAAKICGLPNDRVTLHTTFMGGGFGRRADMNFIEQAVSVARQMPGRPVKTFWSREQDVRHDSFRPASRCRIAGRVAPDGSLQSIDYHLVTQSVVASYEKRTPTPRGGTAETDGSVVTAVNPPVYPVARLKVGYTPVDLHVPAGYWRSVSHSWNSFYIESFIDELAAAAGLDPLAFRRHALATRPRHLTVLDAVAAMVSRGNADGVGFAITESHNTVVGHAVEVAARDGAFDRVTRICCAVDCGPVIHPDNVVAQMEGSIVDGLSAALYGRIGIRGGVVTEGNFDSYRRLGLAECPEIEVRIVDSAEPRPGGVGEPGVPGTAPALTNAIFAATGKRIRSLPIDRAMS